MANDLSGQLWTFDTESTLAPQWESPVKPLLITWKPSAASQVLLIKNKNGKNIISKTSLTGTPAGDETWDISSGLGRPMDGFWVYTLTSGGTLEVLIAA